MEKHSDNVENIANWTTLWAEASKKFRKPQMDAQTVLENLLPEQKTTQSEPTTYDMVKAARNIDRVFGKKPLNEAEGHKEAGEEHLNPVYKNTLGPDQELKVTPNFTDGDILRELNSLKLSLHALEDKINSAYALGKEKEEDSLRKELEKVRSKVDELSAKIIPHPTKDPT